MTDREIRAFWFSVSPYRKQSHNSAVKFDCIPIPAGVIEQGNVRNEKALINILLPYRVEHAHAGQKTYLAIPLQQGFIRSFTLPWISKRYRKSAISLLVDEESAIERSDLLYDFLVLTEDKHNNLQILLGATRKSVLERYVFIFEQAGFMVCGVDFAFSILGQALGFESDEDVLYLRGESRSLQIALFRGAVPDSVRSLSERAEEWASEIRRFLLYYKTQHPDLNLKRLVWSGDWVVGSLAEDLLSSIHVLEAEQVKLSNVPDSWRKSLEGNIGCSEVVVGYGLRISAHRRGLNLWRQPDAFRITQKRYQRIALFTSAIFFLGNIIWFLLNRMAIPLEKEVEQLSRQGVRIQEQVKLQKEIEMAWEKLENYEIGDGLSHIQAIQALPGAKLKIEQVNFKQNIMSLRGSAQDARSVQILIRALQTQGWEQPVLSSYKLTSLNDIEFSLSSKYGRVGTTKSADTIRNMIGNIPLNTGTSLGEGE